MGFGVLFLTLSILVAQWVGILGLGKGNRNGAWWCMLAGVSCTTLGSIGSLLFVVTMFAGGSFTSGSSGAISFGTFAAVIAGSLSSLGSLLFAIGFALHGLQAARTNQRISELEAIAAARGEELNRHRVSYDSAS